jgi:hypothetical protein
MLFFDSMQTLEHPQVRHETFTTATWIPCWTWRLIAHRMPAQVLLLEDGQDHKRVETEVIKCTVRDVTQKWRCTGEGKTLNNVCGLLPHTGIQKNCVNLQKKKWNPCWQTL